MQQQQAFGFKQIMVNHVAATALAVSVLVSGALGVAGLNATGNLPWSADSSGPSVASQAVHSVQVAQAGTQKEARLVAFEAQIDAHTAAAAQAAQEQRATARKEASMDADLVAITAPPTLTQRVAADKDARLAAQEQQRAELAAGTARQETMQRYYGHKEARLEALP